ncbi:hypothetical protein [Amphiplicatus metriothermophilus]|uniref:Uncharacterized protein n=1 Tax=Amphiplicatus metriothermophilus TaxID=1519374 RepID=A0A239PTX6_9PROT|nr:hypothetical protein [Amphiplicatus metriothermophilus]MBB5519277.1 hypothetical protein [Amphiplicatus metriothermophilus]SNT73346.1 hypothetical protein SAMN06297382_1745 [Amphiplicatus metriothermophilus]
MSQDEGAKNGPEGADARRKSAANPPSATPKKPAREAREARLAAALRANLRRRKEAARKEKD